MSFYFLEDRLANFNYRGLLLALCFRTLNCFIFDLDLRYLISPILSKLGPGEIHH